MCMYLEFFLMLFSCGCWFIFSSVYTLKNSSLTNPSGINLKDKQSLCNFRSLPRSGVVYLDIG